MEMTAARRLAKPMDRAALRRAAPRDCRKAPLKVEQGRRVYRTRFMGGLNEPNVPDALRAVRRKRRASIVLTRQRALRALARRHDLQSVLQ